MQQSSAPVRAVDLVCARPAALNRPHLDAHKRQNPMSFAPLRFRSALRFPSNRKSRPRIIGTFCTGESSFEEKSRLQLDVAKALSAAHRKTLDAKPPGAR